MGLTTRVIEELDGQGVFDNHPCPTCQEITAFIAKENSGGGKLMIPKEPEEPEVEFVTEFDMRAEAKILLFGTLLGIITISGLFIWEKLT